VSITIKNLTQKLRPAVDTEPPIMELV